MAKATMPSAQNPVSGPDPFEIEAYKQICEDFRQLNQSFWQAPVIIVSITGGIGVAVVTVDSPPLRIVLLLLAAICNAAWAWVIVRLRRGVMKQLLTAKIAFENKHLSSSARAGDGMVIMKIFVALLLVVAIACVLATFFVSTLFPEKKNVDNQARPLNVQNVFSDSTTCVAQEVPTPASSSMGPQVRSPLRRNMRKQTSCGSTADRQNAVGRLP